MACHAGRPPLAASEEKRTELRIAMEFPKHNWLEKHLIKEQKLKNKGNDDRPEVTDDPSSLTSSSSPALRARPLSQDLPRASASPREERRRASPFSSSPGARKTEDDRGSALEPVDQAPRACDATTTAATSTKSSAVSVPSSEGSHQIGIVKPFHYQKVKPPLSPAKGDHDEPSPKKRKSIEKEDIPMQIDLFKAKPGQAKFSPKPEENSAEKSVDDRTMSSCDVRIGQCFSLADSNLVPLDLSTGSNHKRAPSPAPEVLDLSRVANERRKSGDAHSKDKRSRNIAGDAASQPPTTRPNPTAMTTQSACVPCKAGYKNSAAGVLSRDSSAPSRDGSIQMVDLYDIVRKRSTEETAQAEKGGQRECPKAKNPKMDLSARAALSLKQNGDGTLKTPGPKKGNPTVIDVDALDDNSPRSNPTSRRSQAGAAHVAHTKTEMTSSGGFLATLGARQHSSTPACRTKSVDSLLLPKVENYQGMKPRSAPPSVVPCDRFPISRSRIPPGQLSPHLQQPQQNSVELRRPNVASNGFRSFPLKEQFHPMPTSTFPAFSQGAPPPPPPPPDISPCRPAIPVPRLHPAPAKRLMKNMDGFRVPVKPTPIHYQRAQQPPRLRHSNDLFFPPSGQLPQATMHRALPPRPSVVRAPPGGVSINSTPLKMHQRGTTFYDHQTGNPPKGDEAFHPFVDDAAVKFSPEAAQRFSAQIREQRKQLEEKMNCLNELERKIQHPVASQPFFVNPALSPQVGNTRKVPFSFPGKPPANSGSFFSNHAGATHLEKSRPPRSTHSILQQHPGAGQLITDEKCVVCNKRAYFVCSGCRNIWYCSKNCQFQDWAKHCNSCR